MTRHIVLLRGINLGGRNRIGMAALREALTEAGFEDVRTYIQSGNAVLSSSRAPARVTEEVERVIGESFGLDIRVVARTPEELAAVVERNPLADVADDPKRYQVSFLSDEPDPDAVGRLATAAVSPERLVHFGREIYTWHPNGIGQSKLAASLTAPDLGVTVTVRNWTTVTTLLEMATD